MSNSLPKFMPLTENTPVGLSNNPELEFTTVSCSDGINILLDIRQLWGIVSKIHEDDNTVKMCVKNQPQADFRAGKQRHDDGSPVLTIGFCKVSREDVMPLDINTEEQDRTHTAEIITLDLPAADQ